LSNPFDPEKVRAMTMRFVADGLLDIQLVASKAIRTQLSKSGTGRLYRVSRGRASGRNLRARGFHRASAAGQPPAVNTGRLRQSWAIGMVNAGQKFGIGKTKQTTQDLAVLTTDVAPDRISFTYGSNLKYARALEFGTRRVRSRPYVRPVFNALNKRALTIVKNAITRGFSGGGK
jgi:hypothetical protein